MQPDRHGRPGVARHRRWKYPHPRRVRRTEVASSYAQILPTAARRGEERYPDRVAFIRNTSSSSSTPKASSRVVRVDFLGVPFGLWTGESCSRLMALSRKRERGRDGPGEARYGSASVATVVGRTFSLSSSAASRVVSSAEVSAAEDGGGVDAERRRGGEDVDDSASAYIENPISCTLTVASAGISPRRDVGVPSAGSPAADAIEPALRLGVDRGVFDVEMGGEGARLEVRCERLDEARGEGWMAGDVGPREIAPVIPRLTLAMLNGNGLITHDAPSRSFTNSLRAGLRPVPSSSRSMKARSFGVTVHRERKRLTVSGTSASGCVRLRFSDDVGVDARVDVDVDVDVDADDEVYDGPARAGSEMGEGKVLGSG